MKITLYDGLNRYTDEMLDRIVERQKADGHNIGRMGTLMLIMYEYVEEHYPELFDEMEEAHYNEPENVEARKILYEYMSKDYPTVEDAPEEIREKYRRMCEEFGNNNI